MSRLPFADKELGQHFLKDQKVITSITEDFANVAKNIIEVGPGPGILTKGLSELNLPFHVLEKDERMEEYLTPLLEKGNINFLDALALDYDQFIKEKGISDNLWLVSNLPYNISTPLLIKFIQTPAIKYMTLMFQKEVADKAFAFARTKNVMGSLMVLTQTYFEASLLCKVAPGAFIPPPKVDSAVLSFKRRENPIVPLSDFKEFETFLRLAFSQKRKQMKKVLKSGYNDEHVLNALKELQLPETIRAEALSIENVQELYLKLK